ncbi:hypothetical protein AQUCO_00400173v1 [Aquilegia coerulea]|uniref:Uncharacterized protein n=1 Tax=Aquilegia coerulea TaxID=218851 RepID=A0A2G5ETS7_AQUCA|nr:hypothetical protein AQUCO_00400173v1 [Aquilegia coerulea]
MERPVAADPPNTAGNWEEPTFKSFVTNVFTNKGGRGLRLFWITFFFSVLSDATMISVSGFYARRNLQSFISPPCFFVLWYIFGAIIAFIVAIKFYAEVANLSVRWVNAHEPEGWIAGMVANGISDVLSAVKHDYVVLPVICCILAWVTRYRLCFKQDQTNIYDALLFGFGKLSILFALDKEWKQFGFSVMVGANKERFL